MLYELLTGTVPFTGETPVEIAMKHLSQAPVPPSAHRPEMPRDLDYVVLRALAKDPADRYQSAEEMDADLERIARGIGVSAETAEAATTVLARTERRGGDDDPRPAARDEHGLHAGRRYYEYDEPPRKRTIWPWLLAVLLVAGALVGGWFAYQALQDQLSADQAGRRARRQGPRASSWRSRTSATQGLKELVQREPNARRRRRPRLRAGPAARRPDREGQLRHDLRLDRASRRPSVPDVVGQSRDEAVRSSSAPG